MNNLSILFKQMATHSKFDKSFALSEETLHAFGLDILRIMVTGTTLISSSSRSLNAPFEALSSIYTPENGGEKLKSVGR